MSPVGAIFVPFPLKTGTNLLHPRPPQLLNGSNGQDSWGFFKDAQGFVTAGCWLARRLQQLKASTTMDLGISIFLIFVRCVALRNLELLIKTGWNVFVRFVAENAGRG